MSDIKSTYAALRELEAGIVAQLGRLGRKPHSSKSSVEIAMDQLTVGQRIADAVAATMGSWRFIIIQSAVLTVWIVLNITAYVKQWDPYPFILLNLALSFQAAYAAPFIMMSQNRQQTIDRKAAETDYQVNIKAELEIGNLHAKIDELRCQEIALLMEAVQDLRAMVKPLCAESSFPERKP